MELLRYQRTKTVNNIDRFNRIHWKINIFLIFYCSARPQELSRPTDLCQHLVHYADNSSLNPHLQHQVVWQRLQGLRLGRRVHHSNIRNRLQSDRLFALRSWNVHVLLDDRTLSGSLLDFGHIVPVYSSSRIWKDPVCLLLHLRERIPTNPDLGHLYPGSLQMELSETRSTVIPHWLSN